MIHQAVLTAPAPALASPPLVLAHGPPLLSSLPSLPSQSGSLPTPNHHLFSGLPPAGHLQGHLQGHLLLDQRGRPQGRLWPHAGRVLKIIANDDILERVSNYCKNDRLWPWQTRPSAAPTPVVVTRRPTLRRKTTTPAPTKPPTAR